MWVRWETPCLDDLTFLNSLDGIASRYLPIIHFLCEWVRRASTEVEKGKTLMDVHLT